MGQGRRLLLTVTSVVSLAAAATAAPSALVAGTTERVSVSSAEAQGNGPSVNPEISADGRFVLFNSEATNLAKSDANGPLRDVLLRDRHRGTTRLVNVSSKGVQGDDQSNGTFITHDGRYAAYTSLSANLVPGDTNGFVDAFLFDRKKGRTTRVSVGPGGVEGNADSFIAYLSTNGRFVAFYSFASNLDPATGAGHSNLFVRDRLTGALTLETRGLGGRPADGPRSRVAAVINPSGRFVAFHSVSTNLVRRDTNGEQDVFRRDRSTGETVLVSVAADSGPADGPSERGDMSRDGSLVVFSSLTTNLVPGGTTPGRQHCYLRNLRQGTTRLIDVAAAGGEPDGSCGVVVRLTPDGRHVAFNSIATDIVAGDANGFADSFVLDRRTGEVALASLAADGGQGDAHVSAFDLTITPDGRQVAFASAATNLIPRDTNGLPDVFVRTRVGEATAGDAAGAGGTPPAGPGPSESATARWLEGGGETR